jgi:hypothetical protein
MSSSSTHPASSRKPTPRQLNYLRNLAEQTGTTFTLPKTLAQAGRTIEAMKERKRTPRGDIQRERHEITHDMATRRGDAAQVKPDELSGYGSKAQWTTDAGEEPGPRVVHCKREAYDVYVGRGRGSRWGNPFKAGRDGTREEVIAKYEQWLLTQPELIAALPELRGKVLGCWCAPKACHADVLLRLANAPLCATPPPATPHKGEPHAHLCYRVGEERRQIVIQRIRGAIRVGDLPTHGKGDRYLVADRLATCGELDALLADYTSQAHQLGVVPASPAGVR